MYLCRLKYNWEEKEIRLIGSGDKVDLFSYLVINEMPTEHLETDSESYLYWKVSYEFKIFGI